jgi:DNA-binding transcriptional regulator YdaS (Cro superfamily)
MQLKEYMDAMGVSPLAFAHQLGVSNPTVYRWLDGQRVPEPEMMRRIYSATKGTVAPNDWVLEVRA